MRPSPGSDPRRCRLGAAFLCPLLLLLLLLPPTPALGSLENRLLQACNTCRGITERFSRGLSETAKKNFGGGNTAWEERTLSKYETSEIRLVEIIENLCDSSNFECNNLVEEHEEELETWWFRWKKKYPDLFQWLCIDKIEVCCPVGTYGPDCLACRGGSDRPCYGNGHCAGDGTRGGDGSCRCKKGYEGEFCMDCSDGYYNSFRNETDSVCSDCHASCEMCTGPTNTDCKDCKGGWVRNEEACVDVDECAVEESPCKISQYCLNTDGSFSCRACDVSCLECTGEGPSQCKNCSPGYEMRDGTCTDMDECVQSDKICIGEYENCMNTPGGFKCVCSKGFQSQAGSCVPTVKAEEEEEESPANVSSPDPHEDL